MVKNNNTETNGTRVNTTSQNENILTTASGSGEYKNKEKLINSPKRDSRKKK